MTIEDIILDNDRRGVSALRDHLAPDFCSQAARFMLEHPGHALLCTGFYILSADAPETDGPPGSYFLGRALQTLGFGVTHVTDQYAASLLRGLPGVEEDVVEFPIADFDASQQFARDLLGKRQPSLVVAIERCSLTQQRRYLNMRGVDISPYTAKLDYLVLEHPATVGVGDGGNEIGMGNLAHAIPSVPSLPAEPATTPVSHLVIASVSNWGAYGLIAALSLLAGRNLLPSPGAEEALIRRMVDQGAVDGIAARPVYGVDGFPLEENRQALERLHALLRQRGVLPG